VRAQVQSTPEVSPLSDSDGFQQDGPIITWRLALRAFPREAYALLAILALAVGTSIDGGTYSPAALALVVVGIGIIGLIEVGRAGSASPLIWSVVIGASSLASGYLYRGGLASWLAALTAGGLAVVVVLCRRPMVRMTSAALSGALDLGLLAFNVGWGRRGPVDVVWFIQRSTARLLAGVNPYGASYPTSNPVLKSAHFPYGPTTLLLSVPGRLLGDIRFSDLLVVLALIAAVVALARRHGGGEQGWRCLALCLTLPFLTHGISRGWAEFYLASAIPIWLCWRDRHRWAAITVLGLGLSTVPTALPLLALPFLWWSGARREILGAGLIAVAICLPFMIWAGPGHFLADTVELQMRLPPRPSGLDLDSLWAQLTQSWPPGWIWPSVTLGMLLLVAGARAKRLSRAFYLGAAWLGVSFLFAKWAYFNYYFLVTLGLIVGVALQPLTERAERLLASKFQ